jgi:uroporphyrinogen decarboxylase
MTPRERWRAVLSGSPADRVPCDFWGTGEVVRRLQRELHCRDELALWKRLGVDKCIHLAPRHPTARECGWHIQSFFSLWQVETRMVPQCGGTAEYEEDAAHPLGGATTVAEIERFPWPDPAAFDCGAMREACLRYADYPILGASSEPFYLYCRLRGMERALLDLVELPALAEAMLERIHQFDFELMRRVLEEMGGLIDLVYVAEDLGTQRSLLMSPRLFRRFLKPRMARLVELAHAHGVRVFHHNDGAIRPLLGDLIETGIDILNPIQWRCAGMERAALARDFGTQVVFHGGVDNQKTLPFEGPAAVRRQVRENIELFRGGRGYIVAPCHNIQANTPTESILALYEAVQEYAA